jgi:hypothetical protein
MTKASGRLQLVGACVSASFWAPPPVAEPQSGPRRVEVPLPARSPSPARPLCYLSRPVLPGDASQPHRSRPKVREPENPAGL